MKCPKCSAAMDTFSFKEITIERCTECQGLWFQPGELEGLRRDAWMADYVIDQGRTRTGKQFNQMQDVKCPECDAKMDKVADQEKSQVTYEVCPQGHGTFLDAGEFSDLVHKTFWDKFKRASKKVNKPSQPLSRRSRKSVHWFVHSPVQALRGYPWNRW